MTIYKVSRPELIGKIPTRRELTVLPADKPDKPIGWKVEEKIGVGIVNPRAANMMINTATFAFRFGIWYFYYVSMGKKYCATRKPAQAPSLTYLERESDLILTLDRHILKDREGDTQLTAALWELIDLHQIMVS
jgi:hypothetical protein